jgi:hypothetical protein
MPPSHQTVTLAAGRHLDPRSGVCVMELASMLSGEPFSDHPSCVSRTLAGLLRGYNDGLDSARRQSLKYYASAAIGTAAGRDAERARRRLLRAWLVELRGSRGPLALLGGWFASTDPPQVGLHVAGRVRRHGDEALHARMLRLLDAQIAVGRREPPLMTVADLERHDRTKLAAW